MVPLGRREGCARAPAREQDARTLALARAFRDGARRLGVTLVPEEGASHIAGVVVTDPDAVRDRLARERVIGAVRARSPRAGFHAFNDESDVGLPSAL